MKIESVRLQNYRSFRDQTIDLNDYSCLVGPNGAGKSTVLGALNVFFRESANSSTDTSVLSKEDFHQGDTSEPVRITVTFRDLSADAQEDFADYVRHGKLTVSSVAKFDESTGVAEVNQYGERLVMSEFAPYFAADSEGESASRLKEIYKEIREHFPDLPAVTTKATMKDGLREFESENPDKCSLRASKDQFYGFSRGSNRLERHVQWVYVPAVKDASTEQTETKSSSLGRLLARTVRSKIDFEGSLNDLKNEARQRYAEILDAEQYTLDEISQSLNSRLVEWSHPSAMLRLEWVGDEDKSVVVSQPSAHVVASEGTFETALSRLGHGLQRSYLMALLQELASLGEDSEPTLIFACEEPELYQHPPQARYLASVLQRLAAAGSQVLLCTHSPHFVSGEVFEDVRMIQRAPDGVSIAAWPTLHGVAESVADATGEEPMKPEGLLAKVHQTLQPSLNEMFFAQKLILVEGLEDVAYLHAYLELLGRMDDYRRLGCHVVPTNGKSSMIAPAAIARTLLIPTYIVFDTDAEKPDRNGSQAKHRRDNAALLSIAGVEDVDPLPDEDVWRPGLTAWHSDIGATVEMDIGTESMARYRDAATRSHGAPGSLMKNSLHIGTTLTHAWEAGDRSPRLERLCSEILNSSSSLLET